MKPLSWLNERTGWLDGDQATNAPATLARPSWGQTLPAVTLFLFVVQALTGFFLWAYYSPGAQSAWESLYYLQSHVASGWLLRAVHHFAGQALPVVIGLNLLHCIFTGRYRAPRELVYWSTLLLGLLALGMMITGDLLSWSQASYSATQVRLKYLLLLPVVGEPIYKIAIGGPDFGHLTLTRFTAFHIGLLAGAFAFVLCLRMRFARRVERSAGAEGAASSTQYYLNAAACLIALAAVVSLAWSDGVALGSPADPDPTNFYAAARPEWAFRALYEFSHYFPGQWAVVPIFVVPGAIVFLAFWFPFIAKMREGQWLNSVMTAGLLVATVGLTFHSYTKDVGDRAYNRAVVEELRKADRALKLADNLGIPPTGALTLLRDDAETQGRAIFKNQCLACHDHISDDSAWRAEKTSAPNLGRFATRAWLAGLLDPKRIVSTDYFGATKFKNGAMVNFVKENLADLDADEKAKLEKAIKAVSAEAALPAQREADAKDAAAIAEGRKLIVSDFGCTDCHKFRGKPGSGNAPDLNGYGSEEWISDFIRNPAAKRFYGTRNDRMPIYSATKDESQNILSEKAVKQEAKWLRGDSK